MQNHLIDISKALFVQHEIIRNERVVIDSAQIAINESNKKISESNKKIDEAQGLIIALEKKFEYVIKNIIIIKGETRIVPELTFDTEKRLIFWNENKSIKLGKKCFNIVKILWGGKKRRATIEKIERIVWKSELKLKEKRTAEVKTKGGVKRVAINLALIEKSRIFSCIHYLNIILKKEKFPYRVISIKCSLKDCKTQPREIKGFALKLF
jgi:hypothetical protein